MNNSNTFSSRLSIDTTHGYLTRMYFNIFFDLLVCFGVAYFAAASGLMMHILTLSSGFSYLIYLAIFIGLGFAVQKIALTNPGLGELIALVYSGFIGCVVSFVFLLPSHLVIGAEICTLSVFLAMSMIGLTTKRNLSSWGTYLFAGMIGIIVACIANMFIHSGVLSLIISAISVVVFTLYLAYDTNLAVKAFRGNDSVTLKGLTVIFGLNLFIDLINLFEAILEIFGMFNRN